LFGETTPSRLTPRHPSTGGEIWILLKPISPPLEEYRAKRGEVVFINQTNTFISINIVHKIISYVIAGLTRNLHPIT
jgi:hypothetical protein